MPKEMGTTSRSNNSTPFILSWWPLAIYLFLVVWTPIFAVPRLPPLRADDAWLLIWMVWRVLHGVKIPSPSRGVVLLMVLFGALAATSFLSVVVNLGKSAEVLNLRFFFTVGIFGRMVAVVWLISTTLVTTEYVDKVVASFVTAMVTSGAVVLVQHWDIPRFDQLSFAIWSDYSDAYTRGFYTGEKYRPIGTIGNPNYLGEFYCINLACSLYLFLTSSARGQRRRMIVAGGSAALSAYIVLFASGSRTALICMVIVCIYMVVGGGLMQRKATFMGVAGVLGVLAIAVRSVGRDSLSLPERMRSLFSARSFAELKADDELLGLRFDMWSQRLTFLETDLGAFLWGVGFASSDLLIADNGLLRIWLQYGIFGLAFALFLWLYLLGKGHLNLFSHRLIGKERVQALLFAALFANFFVFELVADGLVQAKQGCVIPALAFLTVALNGSSQRNSDVRGMRLG